MTRGRLTCAPRASGTDSRRRFSSPRITRWGTSGRPSEGSCRSRSPNSGRRSRASPYRGGRSTTSTGRKRIVTSTSDGARTSSSWFRQQWMGGTTTTKTIVVDFEVIGTSSPSACGTWSRTPPPGGGVLEAAGLSRVPRRGVDASDPSDAVHPVFRRKRQDRLRGIQFVREGGDVIGFRERRDRAVDIQFIPSVIKATLN